MKEVRKPKIACLGLAFKPDIDDLRESPALFVTQSLIDQGFDVLPVEPNIDKHLDYNLVNYSVAINEADIIVFLVNHREFADLESEEKISLDFCGVNK